MPSAYFDRKMLKWLPFQALPEQEGFLGDLYERHTREAKPVLSADQYESIEYTLQEALIMKKSCTFTVFSAHRRKEITGTPLYADSFTRTLVLENENIAFDAILDIVIN